MVHFFSCGQVEMGSGKPPWHQHSNPLAAMYHLACCEDEAPLVRKHSYIFNRSQ
jgi:hypothetical protein